MTQKAQRILVLLPCVAALFAGARSATAQARPTASRGGGIAVFGGYIYERPDSGMVHNNGDTVGVDFTRYIGHQLAGSLEVRGTTADGRYVRERTVVVGGRVAYTGSRYHPNVDFLVGAGTILFHGLTPRYQDRSTVYSYGGGVDYDLLHRLQLMADVQETHWNLGHGPAASHTILTPLIVTVGVRYRLPFRPLIRHADPDR